MRYWIPYCLLITVAVLSGCKKSVRSAAEEKPVVEIVGLLPSDKIEGTILGLKLTAPNGVESDTEGNLYVLDAGNNRLIKFDPTLTPIRDAGGFGGAEGLLNSPGFISMGNNLNLYVTDTENRRISIYDRRLNYVDMVDLFDPDDPSKFGLPAAAAINKYGELWVADREKGRLAVFNNYDNFDRFIGDEGNYTGLFLEPRAVVFGPSEKVAVTDTRTSKICLFDIFGLYRDEFGDNILIHPSGAAFDRYGNLWVADAGLSAVLCFDAFNRLLFRQESIGDSEYDFDAVSDLAILPDDKIAVCDTGNNRILIYKILLN